MFEFDIATIIFLSAWTLAVAGFGIAAGFFVGRSFTLRNEPVRLKEDRKKTLEALLTLMESTEQLNEDVDTHNTALVSAQEEIQEINDSGSEQGDVRVHFAAIQSQLLGHISRVVTANRRLENDLTQTRYEMESQAQELDRTRKEARTDPLCQIGNRKGFDEHLAYMISRYKKQEENFGLMLIDVDHFKRVNDTFGHSAGDQILVNIGQALNHCVRPGDFVARLGGDEFAILLAGLTNQDADSVGQRIRKTIELFNFNVGDGSEAQTSVTMSMGLVVVYPSDTADSLFDRADKALYRSKEMGRNRLNTISGPPIYPVANSDLTHYQPAQLA